MTTGGGAPAEGPKAGRQPRLHCAASFMFMCCLSFSSDVVSKKKFQRCSWNMLAATICATMAQPRMCGLCHVMSSGWISGKFNVAWDPLVIWFSGKIHVSLLRLGLHWFSTRFSVLILQLGRQEIQSNVVNSVVLTTRPARDPLKSCKLCRPVLQADTEGIRGSPRSVLIPKRSHSSREIESSR